MTWAAMTLEVNGWADDYPIVDLMAGESNRKNTVGRELSDWSIRTEDGSPKEIVYIDGGHHNNYLGTALAWLSVNGTLMAGQRVMKRQLKS